LVAIVASETQRLIENERRGGYGDNYALMHYLAQRILIEGTGHRFPHFMRRAPARIYVTNFPIDAHLNIAETLVLLPKLRERRVCCMPIFNGLTSDEWGQVLKATPDDPWELLDVIKCMDPSDAALPWLIGHPSVDEVSLREAVEQSFFSFADLPLAVFHALCMRIGPTDVFKQYLFYLRRGLLGSDRALATNVVAVVTALFEWAYDADKMLKTNHPHVDSDEIFHLISQVSAAYATDEMERFFAKLRAKIVKV
jgi:hypothetical protein